MWSVENKAAVARIIVDAAVNSCKQNSPYSRKMIVLRVQGLELEKPIQIHKKTEGNKNPNISEFKAAADRS